MCLEGEAPPLKMCIEHFQMLLFHTCRDAIAGLSSAVCFSLMVASKRNSWRNEALGQLILLCAPVSGGRRACAAVSVFAVFVWQLCLPSQSAIAPGEKETVLHRPGGGGEWWWGAPPTPVPLCVISAWVFFPLSGPFFPHRSKKKKIGRGGRSEQRPPRCSSRWSIATHCAPTEWCVHLCCAVHTLGTGWKAFCEVTWPGTMCCSPESSTSGGVNISVMFLTSQDPRNQPWSSSFAKKKNLTCINACFCGIMSAVMLIHQSPHSVP